MVSLIYSLYMKNQLAKTLYMIASLAAGFFFALTAGVDCVLLIDYANQEVELSVVIIILAASFLLMLGSMVLIVFFNRRFDRDKGLVQGKLIRSRWAMTTRLMSMILVMITMSGYRQMSTERSLLSASRINPAVIVSIAAVAAIVLYFLTTTVSCRVFPRSKGRRNAFPSTGEDLCSCGKMNLKTVFGRERSAVKCIPATESA